ncbi:MULTISPECIES: deoxynucleoside kinase [Runella]|jgi:deoxyadenosine/deoxycytidine kinase|uniref:Deoxynucleoside kinase n=2 Tax=Runella TaxID=105 RepID=A0A369I7P6_9BACT|nr:MULTISPECIES: deoxynucleoside kinase [Runella]MCP1382632.1 deoxynucleoside kinase [Runella salmonicolor]RDB04900.1 deoxynucleoside kinase [Runella aurantiaca]
MHIAITGNIGAGKTTLARKLSEHYKWGVLYEAVEGNPYLADFYEDMARWSFNLQVFFLNSRFSQAQKIRSMHYQTVVQDRTIYEDAFIFAKNLADSKLMEERDYQNYLMLYETMINAIKAPDLIVYLQADLPKLRSQIQKRGRDFEQSISDEYLLNLNELYENFAHSYLDGTLLTINVNSLDFENNAEDFDFIVQQMNKALGYR